MVVTRLFLDHGSTAVEHREDCHVARSPAITCVQGRIIGCIVIARTFRLACFRNERAEAPRDQFKEASEGVGRRATWRLSSKAAST